jgi:hypothetical protein
MAVHRLKNDLDDSPWPAADFTGMWIVEWTNGATKFRGHYLEGKADGDYLCFWPNGRPAQKGRMSRGECVGRWTDYHEDGFVTAERDFIDGQVEGIERRYWESGEVMEVRTMRHSVVHGAVRVYRRDGQLSYEGEYRDGEPWHGVCDASTFEKQPNGGYSILAEYDRGTKIKNLSREDYE